MPTDETHPYGKFSLGMRVRLLFLGRPGAFVMLVSRPVGLVASAGKALGTGQNGGLNKIAATNVAVTRPVGRVVQEENETGGLF